MLAWTETYEKTHKWYKKGGHLKKVYSPYGWNKQLADGLDILAESTQEPVHSKIDTVEWRAWLKRAAAEVRNCGVRINVVQCGDCGHKHEEGATVVRRSCGVRMCFRCGASRRRRAHDLLEYVLENRDEFRNEEWTWHYYVVTTVGTCRTVKDMREKAILLRRGIQRAWKLHTRRKNKGGCFWALDIGSGGMVHANVLYYGPAPELFVKDLKFFTMVNGVSGEIYREQVHETLSLPRVASYVVKLGDLPVRPDHIKGIKQFVQHKFVTYAMDPMLAAKWTAALYRFDATGMMGVFMGVAKDYDEWRRIRRAAKEAHETSCETQQEPSGDDQGADQAKEPRQGESTDDPPGDTSGRVLLGDESVDISEHSDEFKIESSDEVVTKCKRCGSDNLEMGQTTVYALFRRERHIDWHFPEKRQTLSRFLKAFYEKYKIEPDNPRHRSELSHCIRADAPVF